MNSREFDGNRREGKCLNFLRRRRKLLFCLSLCLQLVILTGLVIPRLSLADTGQEVVFNTVPFDPRDIFRGDYVTMRYKFSEVPVQGSFKRGERVYVVLRRGVGKTSDWSAVRMTRSLPELGAGEIVLKGEYEWYNSSSKVSYVHYGLEKVYVEEGRGRKLSNRDSLRVVVAVDKDGNALIKQVNFKDRELYLFKLI